MTINIHVHSDFESAHRYYFTLHRHGYITPCPHISKFLRPPQTNKNLYEYLSVASVTTAPQPESPLAKRSYGTQRVLKYYVRKRLIFQLSWVLYIIYRQKYKQQNKPA
jgi:hypothetical protein